MDWTIASVLISALGIGGIVSGFVNRKLTKAEKRAEERQEAQNRMSILLLQGIKATGALGYATAVAMKRGSANGEVEKSVEQYETYSKELDKFLVEQVVKK